MSIQREGYTRVVIWQPRSGFVCDIGGADALAASFPQVSESYFVQTGKSAHLRSRSRTIRLPVFREDLRRHLRLMEEQGCEVRLLALGLSAHQTFFMDAFMRLVEREATFPALAARELVVDSRRLEAFALRSEDLLAAAMWECTDATVIGSGDPVLRRSDQLVWAGPEWEVGSGDSVDSYGALSVGSGGSAVMEFICPIQGARLLLDDAGGEVSGTLEALDWEGTTVLDSASAGTALDIPERTWKLRVTITEASERPRLLVENAGAPVSPRLGVCLDCSDPSASAAEAPSWTTAAEPTTESVLVRQGSTVVEIGLDGTNLGTFASGLTSINNHTHNGLNYYWTDGTDIYEVASDGSDAPGSSIYTWSDPDAEGRDIRWLVTDPREPGWIYFGGDDAFGDGNLNNFAAKVRTDGTSFTMLLNDPWNGLFGVAVDAVQGYIFYHRNLSFGDVSLYRADLDGGNQTLILTETDYNNNWGNRLYADWKNQRLMIAGTQRNRASACDYDGSNYSEDTIPLGQTANGDMCAHDGILVTVNFSVDEVWKAFANGDPAVQLEDLGSANPSRLTFRWVV